MNRREALAVLAASTLPWWACSDGPPEVLLHLDACAQCRMTVSDLRFVAAATTSGGRSLVFDSIDCLAAWTNDHPDGWRALWAADVSAPGALRPIAAMRFHQSAAGTTPMGTGFVAVEASRGSTEWDGAAFEWEDVRRAVARGGTHPAGPSGDRPAAGG